MNNLKSIVKVGIADVKIGNTAEKLRTSGLGSCVGIVIYDDSRKIAGMAHIMLPDSSMAREGQVNRFKFADTALEDLVVLLIKAGGIKYRLKAKMAGGAQMFQFKSTSDMMRIGPRNIESVRMKLAQLKIPIISEDVGGESGRTIVFDPDTSELHIRKVRQGEVTI